MRIFILLTIPLLACEFAAAEDRPGDAICRRATGKIVIDGTGDDAAWKAAEVIDDFVVGWTKPVEKAQTATKARLLWDDDGLYFFAEMVDADLFADIKEHDGTTWYNDVFELFFKPDMEQPAYYEFQATPLNTHFDSYFPQRDFTKFEQWIKKDKFDWQTKAVLRGTLNDKADRDQGWSVEGKIPWTDFRHTGGRPKPGDVWRFSLCRYDYSKDFEKPALSATAPLTEQNFHRHEDYGRLTFVGK